MNTIRTIAALLSFAGLLANPTFAGDAPKAAAEPDLNFTISGPVTCQNLAVYLIHGKDAIPGKNFLTLQEALEQKQIVVHETGSVNQLAVENVSKDAEIFIQSGDIVKGGRQDRVIAYDLIVPAQSGRVLISSFCVEAGRWHGRGAEAADQFSASTGQLPGKGLRLAVNSARQQGQVWEQVKQQQDKLSKTLNKNLIDPASPSSLQLTLENKDLQTKLDGYVAKLAKCGESKPDVIGFVLAINGKVESAEIYGSSALLRKMWPKMLRAAAVDALGEYQKGKKFEAADTETVKRFLADGGPAASGTAATGKSKPAETDVRTKRIQVITRESDSNLCIETRDRDHKGIVVHRSYIAK